MAIGPKLKWIKSDLQNKKQLFLFLIISFLLSLLIIKNTNVNFLLNTVLITSAFYLFFVTLRDFFNKNFVNFAQNTAHFGFSLLILSILFNNIFSKEVITNLKVGETYQSKNFKIYFEDIETKNQQNYKAIIGKFKIQNVDGNNEILKPELRIYNQPIIITSEADIKTSLLTDKFMTMNSIQNQDYFNVRYQIKPLMIWIWISVFLITLGGLTSLLKKKYED
jgi:cytochrome c-type biogenesis protein CcmF